MAFNKDWAKLWCRILGISYDRDQVTIEILRQRYVDESQGISQLTRHARKMHYPQFCRKLLEIAAAKTKHAERIGERIIALGANLPAVIERHSTGVFLSHEDFPEEDGFARVNPPLRSRAIRDGLLRAWDRIPVIASDHAPHTREEKQQPFPDDPSGMPGVETMMSLLVARMRNGDFTALSLAEKTSGNPSAVLGIPRAGYTPGERADFALSPREAVPIRAEDLHSRCGWTPCEGWEGIFPELVLLDGVVAYRRGEFTGAPARWFPGRGYIS